MRRNVEETRKGARRNRGYRGYTRKDRIEEEVNGNRRKENGQEGQESTGEDEDRMMKSDRERTGRLGLKERYGW